MFKLEIFADFIESEFIGFSNQPSIFEYYSICTVCKHNSNSILVWNPHCESGHSFGLECCARFFVQNFDFAIDYTQENVITFANAWEKIFGCEFVME